MTSEAVTNEVRPFRALCYDPAIAGPIGDCLSQPYDVITPALQEEYYRQSRWNVVRLILNRVRQEDSAVSNRYTRAREHLESWKSRGVLTQSDREAFWVYEQEYQDIAGTTRRLRGFIGAVRLQELDSGSVLPHERIMKGPLEDRLRLTRETQTQLESIWSFYQDGSARIEEVLDLACGRPPLFDTDEPVQRRHGPSVRHRLWGCDEPEWCAAIEQRMRSQRIYIADGHHRYNTMLEFRNEMRREGRRNGGTAPEWEYILMWLVNAERNQMTVLPYHWLYRGSSVPEDSSLLRSLGSHFEVRVFEGAGGDPSARSGRIQRWLEEIEARGRRTACFGLVLGHGDELHTISLKDRNDYLASLRRDEHSTRWKLLDVNVLNRLVLDEVLGIPEQGLATTQELEYTHDAQEAVETVRRGEARLALIMNPTRVSDVILLSNGGEVMPRKSTFFYPKPASGLVFYPMLEPGVP